METNYTKESRGMKATFEQAQRRRLLSTRPQGKTIFPCFHTIPTVKSILRTEKEPCKT
jgi:hypothetical protein